MIISDKNATLVPCQKKNQKTKPKETKTKKQHNLKPIAVHGLYIHLGFW